MNNEEFRKHFISSFIFMVRELDAILYFCIIQYGKCHSGFCKIKKFYNVSRCYEQFVFYETFIVLVLFLKS